MLNNYQLAWVAAVMWIALCGAALAEPTVYHITVKVDTTNSNKYHDISGSSAKSKQQTRQLGVTLDNRDKEPISNVSVKWAIYAHDMITNKLVTVKKDTVKTQIDALSKTTVQSVMVTMKGTPKHTVTTRKNSRSRVQISSKEQPASGVEYYGYSVAVYAGAVLIDEIYSQPSLKPTK